MSKRAATDEEHGLMCKAMAMKVKYRIVHAGGATRKRVPIDMLGVHPKNRGGVYPQPETLKGLLVKLRKWGYNQEEADHQGVSVEEEPPSYLSAPPKEAKLESDRFDAWNKAHCAGHAMLKDIFPDNGHVLFGTLSHSHLLLVLRLWLTRAVMIDRSLIQSAVAGENRGDDSLLDRLLDTEGRLDLERCSRGSK